jgi:hypothetical protein
MMADIIGNAMSSALVSWSKINEKNKNICLYCEKLRLELREAKLELRFCGEIITSLQEGISGKGLLTQSTSSIRKRYCNDEQTKILTLIGIWINVTSNEVI